MKRVGLHPEGTRQHFGVVLVRLRRARDLTIADLARAAGINQKSVGEVERRVKAAMHFPTFCAVIVALHHARPLAAEERAEVLAGCVLAPGQWEEVERVARGPIGLAAKDAVGAGGGR